MKTKNQPCFLTLFWLLAGAISCSNPAILGLETQKPVVANSSAAESYASGTFKLQLNSLDKALSPNLPQCKALDLNCQYEIFTRIENKIADSDKEGYCGWIGAVANSKITWTSIGAILSDQNLFAISLKITPLSACITMANNLPALNQGIMDGTIFPTFLNASNFH